MPDAHDHQPDGRAAGPEPHAGTTRLLAASLQRAHAGPGSLLCLAAAQLVGRLMRFDAADPHWADRDRVAADLTVAGLGSELGRLAGVADLCIPLGPAIGAGVGFALAERTLAARFGRSLVDHRSWVLCSAASLATGPVQEAAWLAGAWRLGRLTVLAEAPDGEAAGLAGFAAQGWAVRRARAASSGEVAASMSAALRSLKPTLIVFDGGLPEPDEEAHDASAAWSAAGARLAGVRRAWLKRMTRHAGRQDYEAAMAGRLQAGCLAPLSEPFALASPNVPASTADTIRSAVSALATTMPTLAVLPGIGLCMPASQSEPPITGAATAGRLIIGTGAVSCGLALHGGTTPLTIHQSTALESSLAALSAAAATGARLVQAFVEAPVIGRPACLAALRAMRNLTAFRPADASEAIECLDIALRRTGGPSVLLLSETLRQSLVDRPSRMRCLRGAYLAAEAEGQSAATLIASGPELDIALRARTLLAVRGLAVAVVSLPCWALFAAQAADWRDQLLGSTPRIALEPGSGFGWQGWLGADGLHVADCTEPEQVAVAVERHVGGGGSGRSAV